MHMLKVDKHELTTKYKRLLKPDKSVCLVEVDEEKNLGDSKLHIDGHCRTCTAHKASALNASTMTQTYLHELIFF